MFCQKCGTEVSDGAKFCKKCGTKLEGFLAIHRQKTILPLMFRRVQCLQT
ncbi:MAG: zinc-ribbon domain-containing protein [Lachnospiraceae bacterium]|nr:zinc-ribbon domain-containing protein [Lachnospiraceae bacterium]